MKQFKLIVGLVLVMAGLVAAETIKSHKMVGPQCPGKVVAAFVTDQRTNSWELQVQLTYDPAVPKSKVYKQSSFKKGTKVRVLVPNSKDKFALGDDVTVRWIVWEKVKENAGGIAWEFLRKP